MKIFVISAHPDDLEIAAGGTLLKMVDQGADIVSVITVCPSAEDNAHRSQAVVSRELQKSYDKSKFELRILETQLHDNGRPNLCFDNLTMTKLSKLIDNCDLAIIPNPQDSHQDHINTQNLALPLVRKRAREVWYMESYPYCYHYKNSSANIFVGIDWSRKNQLLECYSSYLSPDKIDHIKNLNKTWGDRAGTNCAEAFTLVHKYER
jgi:LmbE family N-acetylglucosaminyl deacetylase